MPHDAPHRTPDSPGRHAEPGPPLVPPRARIAALDVIRGFALCGIVLVNIRPIAAMGGFLPPSPAGVDDGFAWLGLFTELRFFPIFALLFGIGFQLLLHSASNRAARPRLLLLRRLLALLVVGLAHHVLLWQGDILTIYAVVGLVVLLPSTWLPRWTVAALAALLIPASVIVAGGQVSLVPGLFLLGSALVRYGVVDRLESSTRVPAVLGLVLVTGAAPALWWQTRQLGDMGSSDFSRSMTLAGVLIAGVYVCTLLVVLRTPLRPALQAVFAPLGRMALTNYLAATVLVLAAAHTLGGPPEAWSRATVFMIAGAVLTAEWLFSTLWLRRYQQGPLEWLWRWATWAQRPPLRRAP